MIRFSAFGIPVTIQPWFFLGLFMIFGISGGHRGGFFAAAFVGVLTLIHELGHAITARRFGATSAIQLNLFVGWASYSADKPLKRSQQILISLAGPLSQLFVGVAGLLVVHSIYHTSASIDGSFHLITEPTGRAALGVDLWSGLTWAGIVIALLNLLPLWPLDGGQVVFQVLRRFVSERRGMRIMAIFSLVLVGLIVVAGALVEQGAAWDTAQRKALVSVFDPSFASGMLAQLEVFPYLLLRSSLLLLIFSGFSCFQTLQSQRLRPAAVPAGTFDLQRFRPADPAAVVAELSAWNTGTAPLMPPGWQTSPWLQAHLALRSGVETPVRAALANVATPGPWTLPDPTRPELAELVPYLPQPLDVRDKAHSFSLARVLGNFGDPATFLELCTGLYQQFGDPEIFYIAATHLARRGFNDDALSWLRRAMMEIPNPDRANSDVAFTTLRLRPDFQQLISSLRTPV